MGRKSQTVQRLGKIEKEIQSHPEWCSPECSTFLPDEYRKARISGRSAKTVQKDYDLCHIFR
jgi:hypothetical protein